MKKIISALLIIVMLLSSGTVAFADSSYVLELIVDAPEIVRAGDEFTVSIGVDGLKDHIVSSDLEVYFDSDMFECVSATGIGRHGDDDHLIMDFVAAPVIHDGFVSCSFFSFAESPVDFIEILRIKFKAIKNGECKFSINVDSWYDSYRRENLVGKNFSIINDEFAINVSNHNPVAIPDIAPTCTQPGKKGGMQCSDCGIVTKNPVEIPALGHTPGKWKIILDDTDNEWIKARWCAVCGDIADKENLPADTTVDGKILGYLGDVNLDKQVNAIDARAILRCAAGLDIFDDSVRHLADIDADGKIVAVDARIALRMSANLEELFVYGTVYHAHKYESKITVNATCEQEGEKVETCSVCGDEKVTVIPKTAHSYKAATCTAPKTCTVCGKTEGNTAAHKFSNATCTTPKKCSVCGKIEGGTIAHKYGKATCYDAAKCTVCGATSGKAAGHKFNSSGKCTVCGVTKQSIIDRVSAIMAAYEYVSDDLSDALLSFKQGKYSSFILSTIFAYGDAGLGKVIEECGNSKDFAPAKSCFVKARSIMESAYRSVDDAEGHITLNRTNALVLCEASIEAQKCITEGLKELRTLLESIG